MYKIKLPIFEGPFDLLLYFIKRDELNIYDIPISKLTEDFLDYMRLMQMLDLDLAGEFIVMASTLMQIKTQLLLPRFTNENGEEIEDPRTELVQKLLEYKQIKEGAEELKTNEEENKFTLYRENFDYEQTLSKHSNEGLDVGLFDLINSLNKIIKRRVTDTVTHNVKLFNYSVDEQKEFIIKQLNIKSMLSFSKILNNAPTQKIVVTFLALLDLARLKSINLVQNNAGDDILITKIQNYN